MSTCRHAMPGAHAPHARRSASGNPTQAATIRSANSLRHASLGFQTGLALAPPDRSDGMIMPGVRRKLHSLAQRTAAKRAADRQQLDDTLARIAGAG